MPGGDRTGPIGQGPMSGRGAGYCGGYGVPGYMNPGPGRGFGRGRGRGGGFGYGRGRRYGFYATGLPGWMRGDDFTALPQEDLVETQKQALKQQVQVLQGQLESINKRLAELEGAAAAK